MAFVRPTGSDRCGLNPKLVSLAKDLRHRSITVAQISELTVKCPNGPKCMATGSPKNPRVVLLCDADRIAWNTYGRPKPNTIVLIDSRGNVAAVSSLAHLETIVNTARWLADEVEAFEQSAYEN